MGEEIALIASFVPRCYMGYLVLRGEPVYCCVYMFIYFYFLPTGSHR